MGYAKYHEDDQRKISERLYEHVVYLPAAPSKIYYECYYCDKSFESIAERNAHIKKLHNVVGPLLFVNGRMCGDADYIESVQSAKIAMCGFSDAVITLNGENILVDDMIDITDKVNQSKIHPVTITIGKHIYQIHFYKRSSISNKEIEKIIMAWEGNIDKNLPITKTYPPDLNSAEIRYLNGFFNYYMACQATSAVDKKKRYEDAYSILSEFYELTPKARVLLKVIAFRLNWIEKLELLCKTSKGAFDSVVAFFNNLELKENQSDEREDKQMIFVEYGIAEYLEAIMSFQKKEWSSVDKFINTFADTELYAIKDNNHKDRILLLKARRMRNRGEYSLAKKYYSEIKTPYFRAEADAFAQV